MSDTLELPPPGQATYADLEALPERYVGEIIDGTLYAQARPASPQAMAASVLVPDIAGWPQERMPRVPHVPWFDLAPDWLCEVASPSTERLDRGLKLERYFRAGVAHVWLVEPLARRIEVLRRSDAGWLLVGTHFEEEVVGIEPFASVPVNLAELWLD